ncbi:MAG: helix-turn-helix transcriptional regulator [Salinivirgaceae bacterium]|nr:helix-turn-helix transcriptional regulator [Salinivirgaceae bacterium]
MVQLLVIITIILCLVLNAYTIVILQQLRKKYNDDFLNSFFYFQILALLFGLYGILGNLLIREILPKFGLNLTIVETISQIFLFVGLPFIITAWFMQLKMTAEICQKKTHQTIAFLYFFITSAAFLAYGFAIKKIPELSIESHESLRQYVFLGFALIEIIVEGYIVAFLFINSLIQKKIEKRILLFRFGIIIAGLTIFKGVSLYFTDFHFLIGLYFILLYFAGYLPLALLSKVYFKKNSYAVQENTSEIDYLFGKYKITPREKEIIIEVCKGKTNKQISEDLFITLQTVKDHLHNIFQKTEVKNRVQLSKLFANR